MKCPHCVDTTLVMSDRQGIEIDYCPNCRGVWLDRGELDKLIERSATAMPAAAAGVPPQQPQQPQQPQYPQQQRRPDFVDSDWGRSGGQYRRKKSWLSDIFD